MSFFGSAIAWLSGDSLGASVVKTAALGYLSKQISEGKNNESDETVDEGVRIQLEPSTDTKIPVLYGDAFYGGNITDAALSADVKTMTYALTLSELTGALLDTNDPVYTFHDVYFNNNRVTFDTDGITVLKTTDSSGNDDESMSGLIKVYFYADGPLQPDGYSGTTPAADTIMPGWGAVTHPMTGLMFAIVEVTYNKAAGVNGLPDCQWHVENSASLPGDVFLDYMTNTSYGAGIAIADIDTTTLTALQTYGSTGFSYTDGNSQAQTGYIKINGLIDTSTEVLKNLEAMARSVNSWITYNIHNGKWELIVNEPGTSAASFTDSNIVGEITVSGTSLTNLYNAADVKYQNTDILDKTDFVKMEIAPGDLYTNEPDTRLQINLPYTNKQSVAMRVGLQSLKQARLDKVITFKADYSYYNLNAGQLIDVTSSVYGYTNKVFRIINVVELDTRDGIELKFTAQEYDASIYTHDITEYIVETDDGLLSIGAIGQPDVPTVTNNDTGNIPHILIDVDVPSGIVDRLEYWQTYDVLVPNDVDRTYVLIGTQSNTNGQPFIENDTIQYKRVGLSEGDFFIKVRGENSITVGPYSTPTGSIAYVPFTEADTLSDNTDWGGQLGLLTLLNLLNQLMDGEEIDIVDAIKDVFVPGSSHGDPITTALVEDEQFVDDLAAALDIQPPSAPGTVSGAVVITPTTGEVGYLYTADTSTIADSAGLGTFSYQWKRDGNPIDGETGTTYTTVEADGDTTLSIAVSWVNGDGILVTLTDEVVIAAFVEDECPATELAPYPGDVSFTNYFTISAGGRWPPDSTYDEGEFRYAPSVGSYFMRLETEYYTIYDDLHAGTGNVKLYRSDGTLEETLTAAQLLFHNDIVEFPFATRELGTDYYILIDEGVIVYCDVLNAEFAEDEDWNFNTFRLADRIPDVEGAPADGISYDTTNDAIPTDPTYSCAPVNLFPADNSIDNCEQCAVVEYDEYLTAGTGSAYLYRYSDDVEIKEWTTATVFGKELILPDLQDAMVPDTEYYILIDEGFVKATDCYITHPTPSSTGLTVKTDWNFTGETSVELVTTDGSSDPFDGETLVQPETNLTLVYDDTVTLSTVTGKSFHLYNAAGDTLIQSFDVSDTFDSDYISHLVEQTAVDTIVLRPTADMVPGDDYYLKADVGVVIDSCGYEWVGIADTTTLNWSVDPGPTVESSLPSSGGSPNSEGVQLTFDRTIIKGVTKTIEIRKSSDDSLVQSVSTDAATVTLEDV